MDIVIQNILTRRSCRAFEEKEIPQSDLEQILQAALHAPSAMNKQSWIFTVIKNRDIIQKLAEVMGKYLENDNYNMYSPQVLIIPSVPEDLEYGKDDVACALENIFLAANSMGIGSCWINQMRRVINNKEIRDILTDFGIPEENTVYGMAALGYPANNDTKELERKGLVTYIE